MLNDRTLKNLKPKSAPYELYDGDGLGVRVYLTGKVSFFHRYSFEGKQQRSQIGHYPAMGLADARKALYAEKELIEQGINPREQKAAQEAEKRAAPLVSQMVEEFDRLFLKEHRRDAKAVRQLLDSNIVKSIGKMKMQAVRRRDIITALDCIVDRGSSVTAKRVLTITKQLFQFALERGVIEDNPVLAIQKKSIGGKETPRERSLSETEIRSFWRKIEEAPFDRVTGLVLKILLLTGQRASEVTDAKWSEVDMKTGIWTIPAERAKNHRTNRIPLVPAVLACFNDLRALSGPSPYLCQSPQGTEFRPLARASVGKAVKRHQKFFGFEQPWTPHDLRRTVKTHLAELRVTQEIRDAIQNHSRPGMDDVYNRAEYLEEKRKALQLWADWIEGNAQPKGQVIPFPVTKS